MVIIAWLRLRLLGQGKDLGRTEYIITTQHLYNLCITLCCFTFVETLTKSIIEKCQAKRIMQTIPHGRHFLSSRCETTLEHMADVWK